MQAWLLKLHLFLSHDIVWISNLRFGVTVVVILYILVYSNVRIGASFSQWFWRDNGAEILFCFGEGFLFVVGNIWQILHKQGLVLDQAIRHWRNVAFKFLISILLQRSHPILLFYSSILFKYLQSSPKVTYFLLISSDDFGLFVQFSILPLKHFNESAVAWVIGHADNFTYDDGRLWLTDRFVRRLERVLEFGLLLWFHLLDVWRRGSSVVKRLRFALLRMVKLLFGQGPLGLDVRLLVLAVEQVPFVLLGLSAKLIEDGSIIPMVVVELIGYEIGKLHALVSKSPSGSVVIVDHLPLGELRTIDEHLSIFILYGNE